MIRFALDMLTRYRRWLLFLPWAAALLVLIKWERYQTFLRPELGVLLKAAYLMLLFLLAAELLRVEEARARPAMLLSTAILLVPLLFVLNARGVELDAYTLQRRMVGTPRLAGSGASAQPRGTGSTPRPDGELAAASGLYSSPGDVPAVSRPQDATLLDLNRRPDQYEGQYVSVLGMTYRNEEARQDFGDGAVVLFRFQVACCAADARPIAVVVTARPGRYELEDNTWVTAQGRFAIRLSRGKRVPVIEEAVLSPAAAPQHHYLY